MTDELAGRHEGIFRCLNILAARVPIDQWCLVGGLMVIVAARTVGGRSDRASRTKDGDVVVDVVANDQILSNAYRHLRSAGYKLPPDEGVNANFTRCTVTDGVAQVDLLAPDDAEPGALDLPEGVRSLAIPGGRAALDLAVQTTVLFGDHGILTLRVPALAGALVVKAAAAIDPRTRGQPRHIQDVAFLLSVVPDPQALVEDLGGHADTVRAVAPILLRPPPNLGVWNYLDLEARRNAEATLQFLRADA